MANRDTSRNSSNRVSFVDISGVPCSDLGDLKQRRIWSFHLLSSFIVEHTISVLNPQSLITFLTQDFRNKECFDQDPPQKTNLCIDLLWRRLNKKVINIILQHKHFLLRCWLGIIFKKYNMLRTFREVFPQYTTDLPLCGWKVGEKQMFEWIFDMRTSFRRLRLWRKYFYWPYCQSGGSLIFYSESPAWSQTVSTFQSEERI